MAMTGAPRNKYWKEFYHNNKDRLEPSGFCKFVCNSYDFSTKKVLDVCCGNGRDTYLLGKHCRQIMGIDYAIKPKDDKHIKFIKKDLVSFLTTEKNTYDIVYCRFGLHSLEESVEDAIIDFAKHVFFEFRSDKDNSFIEDHYRRLINGNSFLSKLIARSYDIKFFIESKNLAIYKDENPMIIRVIGVKT